jgi:hypothetical protein
VATDVPQRVAPSGWRSAARSCQLIAVLVALGTGLLIAYAPLGMESGGSATTTTNGGVTTFTTERHGVSLWHEMGPRVLLIVAIPVLLTLIPLPFTGTVHVVVSWVATALMGLGCVVALLSVGLFYVPTAGLLFAGALIATIGRSARAPAAS